jgi:hypothetical protein
MGPLDGVDRTELPDLAKQVLASIDVASLVSELVAIRRTGRELTALCPFHEDRDPSLSVNVGSGKFFCFGCGARGDIYDLAGQVWGVKGIRAQLMEVARWGGVTSALDLVAPNCPMPRGPAPAMKPAIRPVAKKVVDRREVAALWAACSPVTGDAEVADFLESRGLDPTQIAERDLARALPQVANHPGWASYHRVGWNRAGYRLVARLFDAQGRLASLTARRIVAAHPEFPKALFPPGARAGLLLADEAGRWALRAPDDYLPAELWIGEGMTDHLALACDFATDDESAPGSLAIVGPGSWSKAAADRVPDRVVVVVAVDADQAGDRYLAEIIETFAGRRVRIDRWRPKSEQPRKQS